MKKNFILLAISFFTLQWTNAQTYESIFGDSSTYWSIIPFAYCDNACNINLTPDGDTVINTLTYTILPNYGFIREEINLGRVWFYDDVIGQEFLVMDISLNSGDPFIIYNQLGIAETFYVDSISIIDNRKHVYLTGEIAFCGQSEQLIFIEGIGPNAGFNYQMLESGSALPSYMLCHSKDDIPTSGNTLFQNECDICDAGIEQISESKKTVLKIYDVLGRECQETDNTPLLYLYSDGTVKRVYKTND